MPPELTHLRLDKMATNSQTTFPSAFLWMKNFVVWFEYHRSLFLRAQLTISQHWFRWWLRTKQATSHYLSQCWPSCLMHICDSRRRWVNNLGFNCNNMILYKSQQVGTMCRFSTEAPKLYLACSKQYIFLLQTGLSVSTSQFISDEYDIILAAMAGPEGQEVVSCWP